MNDVEAELNNGLEANYRLKLVGLLCLITLHTNLFHSLDKKLVNRIWELCKKVPGITLHGNVMWFPEQFIMAHLPSVAKMMDKKLVQTLASNRHTFLQSSAQSSHMETKQLHHQALSFFAVVVMAAAYSKTYVSVLVEWLGGEDGERFSRPAREQFDTGPC